MGIARTDWWRNPTAWGQQAERSGAAPAAETNPLDVPALFAGRSALHLPLSPPRSDRSTGEPLSVLVAGMKENPSHPPLPNAAHAGQQRVDSRT